MDAVDTYIHETERALDKPFLMRVDDVFTISGSGTVVTGRIDGGIVKTREEVEIVGVRPTQKTVCTGVEMFAKPWMRDVQVMMSVCCSAELNVKMLKEARL